jgi:hypothetical protein
MPPMASASSRRRSTTQRAIRAVAGLAAAAALVFAAGIAYLVGAVTATGCFIECNDPNPEFGIPILMASVVLLDLALAALWWGFFNSHWRRVWKVLGLGGAVLAMALVAGIVSEL